MVARFRSRLPLRQSRLPFAHGRAAGDLPGTVPPVRTRRCPVRAPAVDHPAGRPGCTGPVAPAARAGARYGHAPLTADRGDKAGGQIRGKRSRILTALLLSSAAASVFAWEAGRMTGGGSIICPAPVYRVTFGYE